jgi:hypothetical protein
MTMMGFIGAGITPFIVSTASTSIGMAAGLASLATLYLIAVGILIVMRPAIARAVAANQEAHAA